jgi:hypothetical protein
MNSGVKMLLRITKRYYYMSYLIGLLTTLIGFWLSYSFSFNRMNTTLIELQSIDILFLLGSLPGILWLFNRKTKELLQISSFQKRSQRYVQWSLIRFIVVDINLVVNILLFFLLRDFSYVLCTAIVLVMLVLCHPTALKLEEEIGLNKKSESEILEDGIQEK